MEKVAQFSLNSGREFLHSRARVLHVQITLPRFQIPFQPRTCSFWNFRLREESWIRVFPAKIISEKIMKNLRRQLQTPQYVSNERIQTQKSLFGPKTEARSNGTPHLAKRALGIVHPVAQRSTCLMLLIILDLVRLLLGPWGY